MPVDVPYNPDFAPEVPESSSIRKMEPQNIEAEKSVLAACLLNQEAIEDVAAKLIPDNFYRAAHQRIFEAMLDLYTRHIPLDQISVADNLKASGQLEAVGGQAYILELASNSFALVNWQNHVEIVKRTSILRDLIRASGEIRSLAYDAPDDLGVVVEQAEKTLFAVTEKRVSSAFTGIDTLLVDAFEELQEMAAQENKISGVASGFKDVDDLFHGFRGGDLVILAARPGVGKTAFALNLCTSAAKLGATVAFLSLEMSASQLVQRVLASEARVSLSKLRAGQVQDADWAAIIEASSNLSKLKIEFDDTPALSVFEFRSKARRLKIHHDIKIIIIDYLQLMTGNQDTKGNREQEVAFISRTLKAIAKELNVPMIALSQLSRATEMRGGSKRPQLSDLRESGAIEQDADIVAFIHRPEYYGINQDENGMPTAGMAEIILAKHRNGAVCDVNLRFLKEQARFADVEDSMLPPAQAAESQQAYDDYASGSNSQPGTSGLGAAMGGEFDVNRSTKIDDEAPF